ncbi:Protein FAM135B [Galemys pyrenaicus]|uniref:Protein FAM135B n=1 Tax=Galemys pyrenaicus TaxID=202257 RepID=A0A8J6DP54_GALPY|nr:Protein FAM135B [Galemys pyrenaicus]
MDSSEEETGRPGPEDAAPESHPAGLRSGPQVYLAIGEQRDRADCLQEDSWTGQAPGVGVGPPAEVDTPRGSPGPEDDQARPPSYREVKTSSELCGAAPTMPSGAQPESGSFVGGPDPDPAALGHGQAGRRPQDSLAAERAAGPGAAGSAADQGGLAVPLGLKLAPSEPCDPPSFLVRDPSDTRASPKGPRLEEPEDVSALSGVIKRSPSVISDSGIESEQSSVAWSEARSRALDLPGDREALQQLVRRHALHRGSLEGGRTESNASLPSGAQASLTSISSLPFEEEEQRELALTKLTKSVSAPQISSPEEPAEDTDARQLEASPAEAPAVPPTGSGAPGRRAPPCSGEDSPFVEVALDADGPRGPAYIDIPQRSERPFGPPGPSCPERRTGHPRGAESEGLSAQVPGVRAEGQPAARALPGALADTPQGTAEVLSAGGGALSRSHISGVDRPGHPQVPEWGCGSPADATHVESAGQPSDSPATVDAAAFCPGAKCSLQAGPGAGTLCATARPLWPPQRAGDQEPRVCAPVQAPPPAPAETFALDSLQAVEVVNLSVSCTTTCLPFSSVPKETPARVGFSARQTQVPITHQPVGSFGAVSSHSSELGEEASERMFR